MRQNFKNFLSNVVDFVFGWGDPASPAWQRFQGWKTTHTEKGNPLPAWEKFLHPAPNSQRLWKTFTPEKDCKDQYSKEDYRIGLEELFQTLCQKASNPDQQFFWAFEQQGANPMPFLESFKTSAHLQQWGTVISELGRIFLDTGTNPAKPYTRPIMGAIDKPFWDLAGKSPGGQALILALKAHPLGGRAGWQLTYNLLRSCANLKIKGLTFSEWLAEGDLVNVLQDGPIGSALDWRTAWSGNSNAPWDIPKKLIDLPGIGPNTFEYILRDLAFPGSQHLFKTDSTNQAFVRLTTLNNHAPEVPNKKDRWREKYWKAMMASGILSKYPIAVINIAIYAALSADCLEIYWEEHDKLQAYEYLPNALRGVA